MASVLIVDDDSDLLTLYSRTFENESWSVFATASIEKAEEKIKTEKYDLILLDLLLPYSDTLITIKQIRDGHTANTSTPIIVLTNLDKGDKTKKALEYGANLCLFKAEQTPQKIIDAASSVLSSNTYEKDKKTS